MEKNVLEKWLEDQTWYNNFISYLKDFGRNPSEYIDSTLGYSSFISSSFTWSNTNEGYYYWSNVAQEYKNIIDNSFYITHNDEIITKPQYYAEILRISKILNTFFPNEKFLITCDNDILKKYL